MSQLLNVSICLTDLVAKAKEGHSAFTRSEKNGKVYVNVRQWVNDEEDTYGNVSSLLLNSKEDKREAEGKFYIGNGKAVKQKEPQPVSSEEVPELDDLPF